MMSLLSKNIDLTINLQRNVRKLQTMIGRMRKKERAKVANYTSRKINVLQYLIFDLF